MNKDIELYSACQQEGLLVNANEAGRNIDPDVLQQILDDIRQADLNRYPDDGCEKLREAYARTIRKTRDSVLPGNGSDQMLGLVISLFAGPDKPVALLTPDFSMYDYYAGMQGAPVVKAETLDQLKKTPASLYLFSNPNNPTGKVYPRQQVLDFVQAVAPVPVAVDEAYMDFSTESVLEDVEAHPNLYVTRTLSKAYGAAGIRTGFLVASEENMARIMPYKVPYSVSTLDQIAACAVLKQDRTDYIRKICQERERMYEALRQDFPVQPSGANFLYVAGEGMEQLGKDLAASRIFVRTWPGQDAVRITVSEPEDNEAVLAAMKEWRKSHAVR